MPNQYYQQMEQFKKGLIGLKSLLEDERRELAVKTTLLKKIAASKEPPEWAHPVRQEYERCFQKMLNGSPVWDSHWRIIKLLRKKGVL